jgi:hypothetical protein
MVCPLIAISVYQNNLGNGEKRKASVTGIDTKIKNKS